MADGTPLLRLPPVDLPPPPAGSADERPSSLAGRAALSLALLLGVIVVAVGVVVALVAVNVAIFRLGRVQVGLVLLMLAVVAALGKALVAMVRRPPEPPDEVEVPAHAEPELHQEIRRLAGIAGTAPPDRVAVVAEVNAYVREFGPLLGLVRGRRTLAIGVPLLDTLTVSQLRAVLAHELGHFAGGDTRLGPLTFRTEQALARLVESLQGSWIASIFVAYWRLQRRVSAGVRRGQELVADRAAVRVAGRQTAADALQAVHVAAGLEALYHAAYLAPLIDTGHRPHDLSVGFRSLVAAEEQVEAVRELSTGEEEADPWASHPPTPERIRRVAALAEAGDVDRDDRAARALLRDPDRWVRAAYERWFEVATGGAPLPAVPWEAWPELVVAGEQQARAAAVDATLTRLGLQPGLAGVRQALTGGRDRDLAASLVSQGWRTGGPDEREAVLRAAVRAVVAREVVERGGGRWALSWAGPVALRDGTGGEVPLDEWVGRAVAGDWEWAASLPTADGAPPAAPGGAAGSPPAAAGAPSHQAAAGAPPNQAAAGAPPYQAPSQAPAVGDGATATAAGAPPAAPSPGLPVPAMPPFQEAGDGWRWWAELPGRMVGSKVRLAVGDHYLALGADTVAYNHISHARVELSSANNAVTGKLRLTAADGRVVKLTTSSASSKGKDAIVQAVAYVWDLLGATVGPRLREAIGDELRRGRSVEVAGLVFSAAGVAAKKKPDEVIPWSEVPDLVSEELVFHLAPAGRAPLKVPLATEDAFLLPDLIPYLRALFA